MNIFFSKNHRKFLMKAHIIFVVKYRKKLLIDPSIDKDVKNSMKTVKGDFLIELIESDKDHIHMLVSYDPKISITQIIRKLKQHSTINVWKKNMNKLKKHFWKEKTFWTDGYFVCSIGNASENIIRNYISSQG